MPWRVVRRLSVLLSIRPLLHFPLKLQALWNWTFSRMIPATVSLQRAYCFTISLRFAQWKLKSLDGRGFMIQTTFMSRLRNEIWQEYVLYQVIPFFHIWTIWCFVKKSPSTLMYDNNRTNQQSGHRPSQAADVKEGTSWISSSKTTPFYHQIY